MKYLAYKLTYSELSVSVTIRDIVVITVTCVHGLFDGMEETRRWLRLGRMPSGWRAEGRQRQLTLFHFKPPECSACARLSTQK